MLRQAGYRIVAQGYRDRGGEIDLIAIDPAGPRGGLIVFAEVKTLGSSLPGHPADRVDAAKQQRLTAAALRFLKQQKMLEQRARFDVIAVWWPDRSAAEPQRIEHYRDAFPATGVDSFFS